MDTKTDPKIDLNVQDMSKDDAMTTLITAHNLTFNEAVAWWKENGKKTSRGFASEFYDQLREGAMDDETFNAEIAAGSANVQKHKGHYDAIRQLANDIHSE